MSETRFDVTASRTTAECYADELERMAGDYGPCDPSEYPHEAYSWDALRAGATALRQQQKDEKDSGAVLIGEADTGHGDTLPRPNKVDSE